MRDPIERNRKVLAYHLKQHFPWLGTGKPDGSADVLFQLHTWYKELTEPLKEENNEQP